MYIRYSYNAKPSLAITLFIIRLDVKIFLYYLLPEFREHLSLAKKKLFQFPTGCDVCAQVEIDYFAVLCFRVAQYS